MRRLGWILLSLSLLFLGLGLDRTSAQPGAGAVLLEFDTSVRSEGMGGAGAARFWGGDPDVRFNPALLGYVRGIRYGEMESQLVPDLADDVWLHDKSVLLGGGGIGFVFADGPIDGAYLDMGTQTVTDDTGQTIRTYHSWMKAHYYGGGISLIRFVETLAGRSDPLVSRWLDVSAGVIRTEYEDNMLGNVLGDMTPERAQATVTSYGGLARVTPLQLPTILGTFRVSAAYGRSLLNDTQELLVHPNADQSDPLPRNFVKSWSVRGEIDFPPALRDAFRGIGLGWLARSLTPLVSLGYVDQTIEPGVMWDDDSQTYVYEHDTSGAYDTESWGWELALGNIAYYRRGHRRSYGEIDGDTTGYGLGFQLSGLIGARWDHATVPQATGLTDVDRDSWSVWIDLRY